MEVRARRFAVNRGELRPELHAVAAPVFGFDGTVVAAIGVAGPSSRLTEPRIAELVELVMAAAAGVSHAMGGGRASAAGWTGGRR